MSKMSQLHAALTAQAAELGFENIRQAEEAGYVVDYNTYSLVKEGWSAQDQAHEAWLKEKQNLIHEVEMLINDTPYQVYKDTLHKVVEFLKGVSHE